MIHLALWLVSLVIVGLAVVVVAYSAWKLLGWLIGALGYVSLAVGLILIAPGWLVVRWGDRLYRWLRCRLWVRAS